MPLASDTWLSVRASFRRPLPGVAGDVREVDDLSVLRDESTAPTGAPGAGVLEMDCSAAEGSDAALSGIASCREPATLPSAVMTVRVPASLVCWPREVVRL